MPHVNGCPLCGGTDTQPFLTRQRVPVHQNLVLRGREAARALGVGQLQMRWCAPCQWAFNAAFDPSLLQYGEHYDNSQGCSAAFQQYLDERIDHLVHHRQVVGQQVVEIGCGKGNFLRRLVLHPDTNNRGLGYDPSYVGPAADSGNRLQFVRSFWNEEAAQATPAADVVLCRHVIEHIAHPGELVDQVSHTLATGGPRTVRIFFETPCLEWILQNHVVWDFFYEHCSLFTARGLTRLFSDRGFVVTSVEKVFGGQYLWLEAFWNGLPVKSIPHNAAEEDRLTKLVHAFAQRETQLVDSWQARIHRLAATGGVCVWGAGAKGVTLVNLVDPHCEHLRAVVDINPAKQGGFVAGTGHPIVAPAALAHLGVRHVVVLNPNYVDEIAAMLTRIAPQARVVDLSAVTDQRMAA